MAGEVPDLTRTQLRSLQLDRLRGTLRRAYDRVPHYRRAFDDAGVTPDDLVSLDDLARFPFTTKADLRDNYPFGMFAVPREQVNRVHASSGTTGKPTVVGYTRDDLDTWAELMARSIRAAGGRPGDVVHVAYGYGLFTGGLGAHYGAERLGCTVVPVSGGMTERQVQLIVDFEPRVIMVTPSYFLAILDEMEAQGIDPKHHQPRGRHLRRRTVDRRDAPRGRAAQRDPRRRHLRPVGGDGAGGVPGSGRDPGRPARLGGPLLPRDHRPGDPRGPARRRGGRARLHQPHQAGDAGDPLPHSRPHPIAARLGVPRVPADAEGDRAHRRHDDRARRQRLPHADRGADPQGRRADPALPVRAHPARQPRRADRPGRGVRRAAPTGPSSPGGSWTGSRTPSGSRSRVEVLDPQALERSLGKAKRISDRR